MNNSGIYTIVNTANGYLYIGSSSNLAARKISHFRELRRGLHGNAHLQRAFNEYGEASFVFNIIEYVPNTDDLITREMSWINTHDHRLLYNIRMSSHKAGVSKRKPIIIHYGYKAWAIGQGRIKYTGDLERTAQILLERYTPKEESDAVAELISTIDAAHKYWCVERNRRQFSSPLSAHLYRTVEIISTTVILILARFDL